MIRQDLSISDYVNFEAAKALRSIGYKVPTQKGWSVKDYVISRPVIQKALEWLRQEHNVSLRISWSFASEGWFYDYLDINEGNYMDSHDYFSKYNDAVNAGIVSICEYVKDSQE